MGKIEELYERIINKDLLTRRVTVVANNVVNEAEILKEEKKDEQISLFIDYEKEKKFKEKEQMQRKKENNLQHTILNIKKRYGKNAIIKAMNLE